MGALALGPGRLESGLVLLASLGASGLAFAVQVLVARRLDVEAFGTFAVLFEVASTVVMLSDLGLATAFVTLYVRRAQASAAQAAELVRIAFAVKLVLATAALALVAACFHGLGAVRATAPAILALLAVGALAESVHQLAISVSQAAGRMHRLSRDRLLLPAARLALVALCVVAGRLDLEVALAANAAAAIGVAAWTGARTLRDAQRFGAAREARSEARSEAAVELLRRMRAAMVSTLCVIAIAKTQFFLVDALADRHEVGRFAAAQRFAMVASIVGAALSTVLMPRAAAVRTRAELDAYLAGARGLALAFAVPVAAMLLGASWLLPWLLGPIHDGAVPAARLMLAGYLLSIVANPASYVFHPLEAGRVLAWMNALQLAVSVGLNLLLIPRMGADGAAWTALVVTLVGVVVVAVGTARLRGGLR
jgi:O-antigen/teichoic acid export membrane protein